MERGDAIFFRRDTWHHAMNFGADQLRVLEFFAPPPAAGTSSAYARARTTWPSRPTATDGGTGAGRWRRPNVRRPPGSRVLGPADRLGSLDGDGAFVETMVSTEHITAGKITIRAGGRTQPRRHGGDATFHVLEGRINILLTDGPDRHGSGGSSCSPRTASSFRRGPATRLRNVTAAAGAVMFAVAPSFDRGLTSRT